MYNTPEVPSSLLKTYSALVPQGMAGPGCQALFCVRVRARVYGDYTRALKTTQGTLPLVRDAHQERMLIFESC